MGARVYIPTLGRFLSVDPVEGGTDNSYAYVSEPNGSLDLDGKFANFKFTTFTPWSHKKTKAVGKWLWQKRNEFVAWHRKNIPWLSDALYALGSVRGGRGGKISLKPTRSSGFSNAAAARSQAQQMGYRLSKGGPVRNSMGQEVFKKGNKYISRDVTGHKGGYWKMFNARGQRIGTYNRDLSHRIGN